MKIINKYILEKLKLNKNIKLPYNYYPQDYDELRSLIEKLLKERGKDADLNDIDISDITDMSGLFTNLDPHNIDISEWDVSNVTNMVSMFYNCENFNSDLNNWDVSKVTNMRHMFAGCDSLKNKPSWYNE